jgi:hypothetical protein
MSSAPLPIRSTAIAAEFGRLALWKRVPSGNTYFFSLTGLSNTERIDLLIEWWEASKDIRFAEHVFTDGSTRRLCRYPQSENLMAGKNLASPSPLFGSRQ